MDHHHPVAACPRPLRRVCTTAPVRCTSTRRHNTNSFRLISRTVINVPALPVFRPHRQVYPLARRRVKAATTALKTSKAVLLVRRRPVSEVARRHRALRLHLGLVALQTACRRHLVVRPRDSYLRLALVRRLDSSIRLDLEGEGEVCMYMND